MNVIPSISRYLGSKEGLLLEIANASPPSRLKQDMHMHLNEIASGYADIVIDTDGLGTSGATFVQYGHRLIAQNGKTISSGERLKFSQVAATASIVQISNADPALETLTHATLVREFKNPAATPKASLAWKINPDAAWDNPTNPDRWKEELIRNQALWMFDYMRKTGSKGIMEALSGGKDSSFNCAMVRVMVELAMHDLGVEGFCKEMSHLPYNDKILAAHANGGKKAAVETCISHMLTAVYMGTNNSSYQTWYAAKTLIEGGEFEDSKGTFKGIGGKFVERNVQDLLDFYAYIFAVRNSTKVPREKKLEIMEDIAAFVNASPYEHKPEDMKVWAQRLYDKYPDIEQLVSAALPGHGIGYENIQARGREVLIMLFANIEAKMAVANPNLDEAYGAYATFGGDLHSGTVNWNGGIHKTDQEAVMEYLEDHGIPGVMERIISLAPANKNRPSAELQPKKGDLVTQFDEDALQGTFPQKAALARLRHHTKIHTEHGERWMNAGELFAKSREDDLFNSLDDNQLFNTIAYFYERWEGPAQHKIHATPIAPTHGENVDKQTSLRTPNLSGRSQDEITQLGIDILFKWAKEDSLGWNQESYHLFRARAWQDKAFVRAFANLIRNREESLINMSFNLRGLYAELKDKGWNGVFEPLRDNHPLSIISAGSLKL
jgi:NAD+ synthase (glutamine-hydrolysing)